MTQPRKSIDVTDDVIDDDSSDDEYKHETDEEKRKAEWILIQTNSNDMHMMSLHVQYLFLYLQKND